MINPFDNITSVIIDGEHYHKFEIRRGTPISSIFLDFLKPNDLFIASEGTEYIISACNCHLEVPSNAGWGTVSSQKLWSCGPHLIERNSGKEMSSILISSDQICWWTGILYIKIPEPIIQTKKQTRLEKVLEELEMDKQNG